MIQLTSYSKIKNAPNYSSDNSFLCHHSGGSGKTSALLSSLLARSTLNLRTVAAPSEPLLFSTSTNRMGFFYAVRIGKKPGVYNTWDECADQVKGFPHARYKKFKTLEEAQQFIEGDDDVGSTKSTSQFDPDDAFAESSSGNSSRAFTSRSHPYGVKKPGSRSFSTAAARNTNLQQQVRNFTSGSWTNQPPLKQEETYWISDDSPSNHSAFSHVPENPKALKASRVTVYTDGCCHGNGQVGSVAGIGVYWGEGSPHNVAEPLPGRATNNRAEIHAAIRAIRQAKEMGYKGINVVTDSQFLINSCTQWMAKWRANNWRSLSGKPVVNKEDFVELVEVMEGIEVEWTHVPGHQGILGNEEADKLANAGARKRP